MLTVIATLTSGAIAVLGAMQGQVGAVIFGAAGLVIGAVVMARAARRQGARR